MKLRIRDLREDYDMTQEEVAKILNVSQRAYSHYEKGDRDIPLPLLIRLADLYKVSLDYIVGREKPKKEKERKTI